MNTSIPFFFLRRSPNDLSSAVEVHTILNHLSKSFQTEANNMRTETLFYKISKTEKVSGKDDHYDIIFISRAYKKPLPFM